MKSLLLILALAAAVTGFNLPAQAVVLNNGIVVVTNHTTDTINIWLEHDWLHGNFIEKT